MKHMVSLYKIVHYFILAVVFWIFTTAAHAQRVALLIGNSKYQAAPLNNPVNDVREMEAALTSLGFKVQKVLDVNQNQMKRAVRDFGAVAQGAEVAFVYYSGHGTQANGENYLLPIGASIDKESDYEVEAVSANALMRQIAGARPKAAIVVLDACRDNPYAGVTKSTAKGLGRMDAPTGTMIAFATSPNTTASDDGYYARVLAARLKIPGAELLDVFRDTTAEVRRLSGGKQEPRISEMSISDRIYLAGQTNVVVAQPKPPVISLSSPNMEAPTTLQTGQVFKDCADCPDMVVIPRGDFVMGSSTAEQEAAISRGINKVIKDNESPQHLVSVSRFALAKTEITRGQFAKFVTATNYQTDAEKDAGGVLGCFATDENNKKDKWIAGLSWRNSSFEQTDEHPVICVSFNDVQAYISWINTLVAGSPYQLPSEAQWEYAARAGTQANSYWGEDTNVACKYANVADLSFYPKEVVYNNKHNCNDQYRYTAPVARYKLNLFGLFDMLGNVWEWTQDCWNDNYLNAPSDGTANKSGDCSRRVTRGGSFNNSIPEVRFSFRNRNSLPGRYAAIGFRIARVFP